MQADNNHSNKNDDRQLSEEERGQILDDFSQMIDGITGALLRFQEILVVGGAAPAEFNDRYLALMEAVSLVTFTPTDGARLKALVCGVQQTPAEFMKELAED